MREGYDRRGRGIAFWCPKCGCTVMMHAPNPEPPGWKPYCIQCAKGPAKTWRYYRLAAGLSLSTAGTVTGLSSSTISEIERGKAIPRPDEYRLLWEAYSPDGADLADAAARMLGGEE